MRILHISDTHGLHHRLGTLPPADVLVHSGDFTNMGTESEVLDFLNWLIPLPYSHKIFVVGNHDLCLWDAMAIEDLPDDIHFLQDLGVTIDGVKFFGLGYNHRENLIPDGIDVLVTHEPPIEILDKTMGTHWGNLPLKKRIDAVKPRYHLFGHAHDAYGTIEINGTTYYNGSLLNDYNQLVNSPRIIDINV